jgi:restriction system protein
MGAPAACRLLVCGDAWPDAWARSRLAAAFRVAPEMAVPDYETLMRPVLAELANGEPRPIARVRDRVALHFKLRWEDLDERLPSGRGKVFTNRVGWATTYLLHAGLIERPRRAVYRINARGREVLDSNYRSTTSASMSSVDDAVSSCHARSISSSSGSEASSSPPWA